MERFNWNSLNGDENPLDKKERQQTLKKILLPEEVSSQLYDAANRDIFFLTNTKKDLANELEGLKKNESSLTEEEKTRLKNLDEQLPQIESRLKKLNETFFPDDDKGHN
ncbi:MAG: hypothetical protein M3Q34_04265 [bacterium]|nr:hypothetical protein [bacterium]